MKEDDQAEEALRRLVRMQLSFGQSSRRTATMFAVVAVAMIIPIILLAVSAISFYSVWTSDGFKEVADFLRWLFNCMAARCP